MYKYISNYNLFTDAHLNRALLSIFNFLAPPQKKEKEPNKDRGQGFIALGKMSLLVPKTKFMRYVREIFEAIKREIEAAKPKQPGSKGAAPVPTLEVLTCVKFMFKNYGEEFNECFDMVIFTNDLFYFGFNKQLIETLTELSKICKAKYKGIT